MYLLNAVLCYFSMCKMNESWFNDSSSSVIRFKNKSMVVILPEMNLTNDIAIFIF